MCNSNSHFSSVITSVILTAWLFCEISVECLQASAKNRNICFLKLFDWLSDSTCKTSKKIKQSLFLFATQLNNQN